MWLHRDEQRVNWHCLAYKDKEIILDWKSGTFLHHQSHQILLSAVSDKILISILYIYLMSLYFILFFGIWHRRTGPGRGGGGKEDGKVWREKIAGKEGQDVKPLAVCVGDENEYGRIKLLSEPKNQSLVTDFAKIEIERKRDQRTRRNLRVRRRNKTKKKKKI